MNAQARLAIAILFPILALGVWVGDRMQRISHGAFVRFQVEGYDPRDLLSGHYVRYRVDYGLDKICSDHIGSVSDDMCLCLQPAGADGFSRASELRPCQIAGGQGCDSFIRGQCTTFGRFEAGIERYYFSEEYSQYLMSVPPESSIEVSISPDGNASVVDFLANGKSITEYAAEMAASREPTVTPEQSVTPEP